MRGPIGLGLISIGLILTAATCGINQDTSAMSAYDGGQNTILFTGGGDGPRRGGLFVEVPEGADPTMVKIYITMPKLNCDRSSCASFDVIRKDSSIHPLGAIPKGEFDLSFTLAELTGLSKVVDRDYAGPWIVLGDVFVSASDGEHREVMRGHIEVVVLKRGYVGLNCNGPDVAWSVQLWGGCSGQYTTKGRTALCGKGCR